MEMLRIKKDLTDLIQESPSYFSAAPIDQENLFNWRAAIFGPEDSPYEGGIFISDISFPRQYPYEPPQIKFVTPILNPKINDQGIVCVDILGTRWSPVMTISDALSGVLLLLKDIRPCPSKDSWNQPELRSLYEFDRTRYENTIREHTRKHAIDNYEIYAVTPNRIHPNRINPNRIKKVLTLSSWCRMAIRGSIQRNSNASMNYSIRTLAYPTMLKNYLMFRC